MITIVGLGREKDDITVKGLDAIKKADILFVRTLLSSAGSGLKKYKPISMDDLYESVEDFDDLNKCIADRILSSDADKNIVYCVDGNGFSDSSVEFLASKESNLSYIAGVQDLVIATPTSNYLTLNISDIEKLDISLDTAISVCVTNIYDKFVAGDIKLYLLRFYGYEQKVYFSCGKDSKWLTIEDLDKEKKYSYNTSVFIPSEKEFNKSKYGFSDLVRITKRLTAVDGCEWDKVQTHSSIAHNVVEEAYELAEAIANDDIDNIIEESGDIILQGVFHSDIARRYDEFNIDDVLDGICKKLITRHTHIFGSDKASNDSQALEFWEKAKEKEKNLNTLSDKLDKIPVVYPSILKVEKALSKIKKEGLSIDKKSIIDLAIECIKNNDTMTAIACMVLVNILDGKSTESNLLNKASSIIDNAKNIKDIKKAQLKEILSGK